MIFENYFEASALPAIPDFGILKGFNLNSRR
jgi:hypothetical protein